jgi:hypothetical protein
MDLVGAVSTAFERSSRLTATATIATMAGGSSISPAAVPVSSEDSKRLWYFCVMITPDKCYDYIGRTLDSAVMTTRAKE